MHISTSNARRIIEQLRTGQKKGLTHLRQASHKMDISKQCKSKSDAAGHGV